jgi:hypothetical protein
MPDRRGRSLQQIQRHLGVPPCIEVNGVPAVATLRSTARNAGLKTPTHLRLGALGDPERLPARRLAPPFANNGDIR